MSLLAIFGSSSSDAHLLFADGKMTWQNTFHCKGLSIPGSPCTSAVRIGGHISSLLGDQNGKVGIKLMLGTGIFSIRPPNKSEKDKRGYGALRDVKWGTGLLCDRHSHIEFAREHTGTFY